jgi:hypothetical protein
LAALSAGCYRAFYTQNRQQSIDRKRASASAQMLGRAMSYTLTASSIHDQRIASQNQSLSVCIALYQMLATPLLYSGQQAAVNAHRLLINSERA